MAVGNITRGTTNTNRLRRVDRWIATQQILRTTDDPLVVDLGYGASATTPVELATRLSRIREDIEVVGIEIDPARVTDAQSELEQWISSGYITAESAHRVSFRQGGFETPLPAGRTAAIIRAFNVLRQYDEAEVAAAWDLMVSRLQPDGMVVEGTCDEIGRISTWIALTAEGPQTLTISVKLSTLDLPSIVAERLPKALIHHNVPGEPIYDFLTQLDKAWLTQAPLSAFGATQRWVATVQSMKEQGWPIRGSKSRWKLGELTVDYAAIAPRGPDA